uniref:OmpA-like domain-containing protein n=1 Tax=candidate division WOR-3 bacterium TaxID=2052148 RepID=A0A7C4XAS8_UNCW3
MFYLLFIFNFPSTFGGKGIYWVKSADTEWLLDARSVLVLNVDGDGYRYETADSSIDYGSGRVNLGYLPSGKLEIYTVWRIHGQGHLQRPLQSSEWTGDMGDVDIGAKGILKKLGNTFFSGDLSFTLPVGQEGYSNEGFIIYPKFLTTTDLGSFIYLLPLRMHLNIGVPIGRKELSDNFPLNWGIAFELPSKFFTHYIEISRNHERNWDCWLSPGLKFHPFYRFSISVGADFGIVRENRLLGAHAGISLNSSLTREREILPTGNIAGEIRDKETNSPLSGEVRVVEIDEVFKADPVYGVYKILGLPKGIYTLKVNADNYAPQTRVVIVESGQSTLSNFSLAREYVNYEAVVIDAQTKNPLGNVSINIEGKTKISLRTDENGTIAGKLIPGDYEISANLFNYSQFKSRLSIIDDRSDTIMLKPIEVAVEIGETPEAIIYFDFDDANIRQDQKPELDRIAEFLKSYPKVKCELRGHTDSRGNINYNQILSLARANSVMDYLVKVHGIEKERISTMAFSKTKLVKDSPEKSRRVEIFLIK